MAGEVPAGGVIPPNAQPARQVKIKLEGFLMKMYVKSSSTLYKFLPKSGRTDYNSLKFAFASLAKGDYLIDNKGVIYEVLDSGQLYPGFLESSRVIEVKKIAYNALPDEVKNAIYNLATGYPKSQICKKALEVAQQG